MSLILCRQELVSHPYYIEKLGIHISSSPELCYVLYHHPLLAMDGFIDEPLIEFIETELNLPFLAGKLKNWNHTGDDPNEKVFMILEDCHYYTSQEISQLRYKIAAYKKMNPLALMKETADYYFQVGQYGRAAADYEKILDSWRVESHKDVFTATLWNNIGACYAGMFRFEKAAAAYDMSYKLQKDPETLKKLYFLTRLKKELVLKERYRALIKEEQKKDWDAEFEEVMQKVQDSEAVKELERMFRKEEPIRIEEEKRRIEKWKQDYRKMI